MDMITVILTSLLITFEFLSLFVAFSISGPLEKIVGEMEEAIFQLRPLFSRGGLLMPELNHIVARFDCFLEAYLSRIRPFVVLQQWFMQAVHIISPYITDHIKSIDAVTASLSDSIDKGISKKTLQQSMQKFETILRALQDRLISLSSQLSLIGFDTTKYNDIGALHKSQKSIPYIYIRPLIFLIVMSDSFCESFFPIYVNTLYQPFWGLSREIVLGIPISLYMLVFAVSILLSGIWSEKVGWNKLLVAGGFLNALGLIAVPISVHFLQLMVLRSLSALGVGLFFMGCQRFIVDNTDADTRAQGMATFASAFFSGSICGTVIGGMLADKIGYGNVFYISGFISFLTLYFVFVLFPFSSHKASHNTPQRKILKDLIQVIKDKEFSAVVLLQAIPAKIALIGYLSYFVPLYLKKIGILQSNIARVAMCYGLAMVFLGPIFTKYLDRQRHRKYHMIAGGVVSGLSMTIYYFYSGFEPTLFAVIMLGVAHTVSVSSQASLISETNVVKAVGVGIGLGLFRFWERLGNVLGPIVMGFLIAKTDYETSAIVLGALSLISSCVYILLQIYWKRRSVKIMR